MSTSSPSNVVTESNHITFLKELAPDEREVVSRHADYEVFNEGRTILREGDVDQSLWVILSGRCVVVKTLQSGCEQQFAVLHSGALFGELSFVEPAPHSMSIRSLEDVEVMRIRRAQFDHLVREYPAIALKLINKSAVETAARVRRMNRYTIDLFERSGEASRNLARITDERDSLNEHVRVLQSEVTRLRSLIPTKKRSRVRAPQEVRNKRWINRTLVGSLCTGLILLMGEAVFLTDHATGWPSALFDWFERTLGILPFLV